MGILNDEELNALIDKFGWIVPDPVKRVDLKYQFLEVAKAQYEKCMKPVEDLREAIFKILFPYAEVARCSDNEMIEKILTLLVPKLDEAKDEAKDEAEDEADNKWVSALKEFKFIVDSPESLAESVRILIEEEREKWLKDLESRLAPHYRTESGSDNVTMTDDYFLSSEAFQALKENK